MESRGTVIQGDGRQQVLQKLDDLLEYGFGRLDVIIRDHKIASIDHTEKLVRAPPLQPRRTRA